MKNIYTPLNAIIFLTCLLSACSPFKGTNEHPATRDFRQQMDKSITQMDHLYTEANKLLVGNKGNNYDQALRLMQKNDQQATQVLHQLWAFLGKFEYDRSSWTSSPPSKDKGKPDPLLKRFESCEGHAQTIGFLLENQGALLTFAKTAAGKQESDYLTTILDHGKQIVQSSREARNTCSRLPVERLHSKK
jgi:Mg2+ and Co2+ transporter CorA